MDEERSIAGKIQVPHLDCSERLGSLQLTHFELFAFESLQDDASSHFPKDRAVASKVNDANDAEIRDASNYVFVRRRNLKELFAWDISFFFAIEFKRRLPEVKLDTLEKRQNAELAEVKRQIAVLDAKMEAKMDAVSRLSQ